MQIKNSIHACTEHQIHIRVAYRSLRLRASLANNPPGALAAWADCFTLEPHAVRKLTGGSNENPADKSLNDLGRMFWWRRRELNSCPKTLPQNFLRAHPLLNFFASSAPQRQVAVSAIPLFPYAAGISHKVFLHDRRRVPYLQVNVGRRACCDTRQRMRNCCYYF